jgi:group I intron endonuclease
MEDKFISCVYEIRNTVTNRHYVGSTVNFNKRKKEHQSGLCKGVHHNRFLQRAFDKYGDVSFVFSILEIVEDKSKLIEREQFWIDSTSPQYNIAQVAGSTLGVRFSEEARANISRAVVNALADPEVRKKIGDASRKRFESEEYKARLTAINKGKVQSEAAKKKISAGNKGRVHTEAELEKMSKARAGYVHSEETKQKISESLKRRNALLK